MSLSNFDLRRGASAENVDRPGRARDGGLPNGQWQASLGLRPTTSKGTFLSLLIHFSASILFLVFLNSIQPFYISQLDSGSGGDLDPPDLRIGALTGQLVFADELASLFLVLVWGALADRIGIGRIATIGYCFISAGLMAYAVASKPWPHLLWARLLFAVGGSAVTAMLTASLATYAATAINPRDLPQQADTQASEAQSATEATPLLPLLQRGPASPKPRHHGRLASLAGLFTGVGAILAVFLLLPLPVWLASFHEKESHGDKDNKKHSGGPHDPHVQQGTREAFLIAAALALVVAVIVAIGLDDRRGASASRRDRQRNVNDADTSVPEAESAAATTSTPAQRNARQQRRARLRARLDARTASTSPSNWFSASLVSIFDLFTSSTEGFRLAFHDTTGRLGLAFVGGALARGITIASTIFLPLLISNYFYTINPDLCPPPRPDLPINDVLKEKCRQAYTLTSAQAGVLQTVSLCFAPVVGLMSDRVGGEVVMWLGSSLGLAGFLIYGIGLPGQGDPRVPQAWIAAVLLGICQITAIVTSLMLVSQFKAENAQSKGHGGDGDDDERDADDADEDDVRASSVPIAKGKAGAIAGAYSSLGSLSILLISLFGGWLFDLAPSGPFLILAVFAGVVALYALIVVLWTVKRQQQERRLQHQRNHPREAMP